MCELYGANELLAQAARAEAAGCKGLPHVYQILLGTPEAAEASEEIGRFLRAFGSLTRQSRGLVLRKNEPASVITLQLEALGHAAHGRMS
jgi:hypothetical protein